LQASSAGTTRFEMCKCQHSFKPFFKPFLLVFCSRLLKLKNLPPRILRPSRSLTTGGGADERAGGKAPQDRLHLRRQAGTDFSRRPRPPRTSLCGKPRRTEVAAAHNHMRLQLPKHAGGRVRLVWAHPAPRAQGVPARGVRVLRRVSARL